MPLRALILAMLLTPAAAYAQTDIALGGLTADPGAPVEVTADSLTVDQETRSAVFSGNVVIGQGEMRIAAQTVQVFYDDATGDIARLVAEGQVTFVTATEAAEASRAIYDLISGTLTLSGEVLLTQGASALAAETMVVNLNDGTARMEGRVRTVFQQAGE